MRSVMLLCNAKTLRYFATLLVLLIKQNEVVVQECVRNQRKQDFEYYKFSE